MGKRWVAHTAIQEFAGGPLALTHSCTRPHPLSDWVTHWPSHILVLEPSPGPSQKSIKLRSELVIAVWLSHVPTESDGLNGSHPSTALVSEWW